MSPLGEAVGKNRSQRVCAPWRLETAPDEVATPDRPGYAEAMSEHLRNQLRALMHTPEPPGLGPGPRAHVQSADSLRTALQTLRRQENLPERQHRLLLALVLLWHDHLEAAHRVVQEIPDADGSFLHAIMHRREPDYWNSKYWWRRVGDHPVFGPMGQRAEERLASGEEDLKNRLVPDGRWDPFAFVDECQRVTDRPPEDPEYARARDLQVVEFEEVLAYLLAHP